MLIYEVEIPENLWVGIHQTGSTVICSPPVTDTDTDYIICSREGEQYALLAFLKKEGFKESIESKEEYGLTEEGFYCLRKGKINLIVTEYYPFYEKFVIATKLAKNMNLLLKKQRIALFQYVLYGNTEG